MRVLIHRQHGHPMRRRVTQSDPSVDVTDDVGEWAAARNDEHAMCLGDLANRRQQSIEVLRSGQKTATHLDDEIDIVVRLKADTTYAVVVSGFSRTFDVGRKGNTKDELSCEQRDSRGRRKPSATATTSHKPIMRKNTSTRALCHARGRSVGTAQPTIGGRGTR